MPIYSKPPIYKKELPWASKQSPVSSRPSFGILESLGIRKPAAKKEAASNLRKLFGEHGYGSQWQLREFARKAPYAPLPGTVKKLTKNERLALIKELQQKGKPFGYLHGLSEKAYRERILPRWKKEKYKLHIANKFKEEKLLERKIQLYEKWSKGI